MLLNRYAQESFLVFAAVGSRLPPLDPAALAPARADTYQQRHFEVTLGLGSGPGFSAGWYTRVATGMRSCSGHVLTHVAISCRFPCARQVIELGAGIFADLMGPGATRDPLRSQERAALFRRLLRSDALEACARTADSMCSLLLPRPARANAPPADGVPHGILRRSSRIGWRVSSTFAGLVSLALEVTQVRVGLAWCGLRGVQRCALDKGP